MVVLELFKHAGVIQVIIVTLKLNSFAGQNIIKSSDVRLVRCKLTDLRYSA